MKNTLILLTVGAVAGAAGAHYLLLADRDRGQAAGVARQAPEAAPSQPDTTLPAASAETDANTQPPGTPSGPASLRLALHESVTTISAFDELESRIAIATALPRSRARDAELTALLLRYAELDPARATAFAWSEGLELRYATSLMRVWTSEDADAAVAWLGRMSPGVGQRQLALAVLDVLGYDRRSVDRVAAMLAPSDRFGLELDVLTRLAESDPAEALRAAMSMPTHQLATALNRIAPVIVRSDPQLAFEAVSAIDDESVRINMTTVVLNAWAEADPEALFTMLEALLFDGDDADPFMQYLSSSPSLFGLFQRIAESNPERLLALAEQLPNRIRTQVYRAALQTLAITDPQAALARIELVPLGQERTTLMNAIASAWGRQDPSAALHWARSLSPESPQVMRGVISGIASVDVHAAVDVIESELRSASPGMFAQDPFAMVSVLSGISVRIATGGLDSADIGRVIGRLVDIDHQVATMALGSALGMWVQADAEAALSWATAHESRLAPSSLTALARSAVTSNNAEYAVALTDSLTPQARASWVQGIAEGLASYSVERAIAFLDLNRGQPGYDAGLAGAAVQVARNDPAAAAALLGQSNASPQINQATAMVAGQWAQRDPQSAAQWATGIEDEQVKSTTFGSIASVWASLDASAARTWILTLPEDAARDRAITALLTNTAARGDVDVGLLDAYSAGAARDDALTGIVSQLARANPTRARELLDTWTTDPQRREQLEQIIARQASEPGIITGFPIPIP